MPFLPRGVVDGDFLPDDPQVLLENGLFYQVPLMIGNTDAEGILVADIGYLIFV